MRFLEFVLIELWDESFVYFTIVRELVLLKR